MTGSLSPTITRRRLRIELRRLREAAGQPMSDVATALDWSMSKLIRIENGSVSISVTDLRALLDVYATPPAVVEELVGLARGARERGWWSTYREILSPQQQEFIGYEADAARVGAYHPTLVPDLLQTEEYARAVIAEVLSDTPPAHREGLLEVKLRRQREILSGETPPSYAVIVDEAALRRPVGGVSVTRGQFEHLAGLQEHPHVRISVLPFAAGAHPGLTGPFQVLEFADEADASQVCTENAFGELVIRENPELVTAYTAHQTQLRDRSCNGHEAVDFIHRLAKELG